MLKKFSRIAIAAALGAAALAIHVDTASAQAPRPTQAKVFEQGQGRSLPYHVSRSGDQNESHPYYHLGWWYNAPWWEDNVARVDSSSTGSAAAFRVYGSARASRVGHPYHTERHRYYRNGSWYDSPVGFLAAPITLPLAVATAPFRALSGGPYYGRGRHADWCAACYRSYNPSTNTWVSSRGVVRRCVGPYG
jgi:BA14K-like protein